MALVVHKLSNEHLSLGPAVLSWLHFYYSQSGKNAYYLSIGVMVGNIPLWLLFSFILVTFKSEFVLCCRKGCVQKCLRNMKPFDMCRLVWKDGKDEELACTKCLLCARTFYRCFFSPYSNWLHIFLMFPMRNSKLRNWGGFSVALYPHKCASLPVTGSCLPSDRKSEDPISLPCVTLGKKLYFSDLKFPCLWSE